MSNLTKEQQEAINTYFNTPWVMSPEEQAAIDKECERHYDEVANNLYEGDCSWMNEPVKHYTKCVTGYTKNNILLDAWSRYIREQEELSTRLGMKPHELLADQARYEIAHNFAHWFAAYMDSMVEAFEK